MINSISSKVKMGISLITISCSVKMWSKTQLQFSFGANYRTMVDLEKDRKISKNLVKF